MVGHQFRGAGLSIGELGVLMDVPPPGHHLGKHLRGTGLNSPCQGLGLCRGAKAQRRNDAKFHRALIVPPPW